MARPSRPTDPTRGSQPLWLPRGSVRALIALSVIGVWAILETNTVGVGGASDAIRSMAIAVAAGYGVLRDRERRVERPHQ